MSGDDWTSNVAGLAQLEPAAKDVLAALHPVHLAQGTVLFRPGDMAAGFLIVLAGRVAVHLTGRSGREMLLYAVTPGDTCIQTTLGLLGEQAYGGEAFAETPVTAVQIPKGIFDRLMASSQVFRSFVFRAFGARMSDVIQLVEKVAFVRIEARLAAALLARADADGQIAATHQDLAVAIGSAREVVSRRLEAFQKAGYVALERGVVRLVDAAGLRQRATMDGDLVTDPAPDR